MLGHNVLTLLACHAAKLVGTYHASTQTAYPAFDGLAIMHYIAHHRHGCIPGLRGISANLHNA